MSVSRGRARPRNILPWSRPRSPRQWGHPLLHSPRRPPERGPPKSPVGISKPKKERTCILRPENRQYEQSESRDPVARLPAGIGGLSVKQGLVRRSSARPPGRGVSAFRRNACREAGRPGVTPARGAGPGRARRSGWEEAGGKQEADAPAPGRRSGRLLGGPRDPEWGTPVSPNCGSVLGGGLDPAVVSVALQVPLHLRWAWRPWTPPSESLETGVRGVWGLRWLSPGIQRRDNPQTCSSRKWDEQSV